MDPSLTVVTAALPLFSSCSSPTLRLFSVSSGAPAAVPPHDKNTSRIQVGGWCIVYSTVRAVQAHLVPRPTLAMSMPDKDDTLLLTPASISISPTTGKIVAVVAAVLPKTSFPSNATYINYGSKLLIPGLVDAHVHLNEPGRTEWEGFNTGTRAAASGGVTTVVDMPLNAIPPTTTLAGFKEKLAASRDQCWVDVGFYGGVIPGNVDELLPLVEAGVRGFKGFLIESGVEEFPAISSTDIELAMQTLNGTPTTLMFHAEMIPPITDSVGDAVQISQPPLAPKGTLKEYQTFLESRPPSFETYAIEEIISLAHLATNLHLHIVHLSATQAIPILKEARERGGLRMETADTSVALLSGNS
ncbi:hypothetical protein O1611_g1624 [Lasiodiplodia mahajangana]|uniref:Uncharacterized protein n=1 Tax=Lasiodiplodia mahajangana TaxID=1108764 RepID=A0ACC2JXE2_9PEZI|nr:hypothetical protein O1611_g1624 [Lasiodiplodia mahajangana]